MKYHRNVLEVFVVFFLIFTIVLSTTAKSQQKLTFANRVHKLEELVKKMSSEQRTLEARIAVLEQLHLTPPPEVLRQSYISASKDAIVSTIVNLAANAYQYRIRPATMAGGGGKYDGYKIPKAMSSSEYAAFTAEVYPDFIIIMGVSKNDLGSVQGKLCDDGRMIDWVYTGDFE